jgi:beta-glucosidase
MAEATLTFPRDFLWGTGTAAHQVEGGNTNNDWWAWEQRKEGKVFQDQSSGDACGWWAPGGAEADIQRMKALHNNSHRLSIEWSRIEPEPGRWDHDALDRYREILKAMRDAGIKPMVTLHHFTNPMWIWEQGEGDEKGWLNPDIVSAFRRFTEKAVSDLSDLCDLWCTINEPTVYASFGYFTGAWYPGHQDLNEYFKVLYHLLLAHAAAYQVIHDYQPQAKVGAAHRLIYWQPRRPRNPLDRMITSLLERMFNRLPLNALHTGQWKPLIGKKLGAPELRSTQDYIGLNYYERFDAWFSLRALRQLGVQYAARPGAPKGPTHWGELYPDGLFETIKALVRQFNLPIYITENGVPDEKDTIRPAYMLNHLHRVWKAIQFNWPVMGYYWWSLIDNFEWAEVRSALSIGLYTVDFATQERKETFRKSRRDRGDGPSAAMQPLRAGVSG